MTAYAGVWSVVSDTAVTPQVEALARKLVGGMLDTGGIPRRQQRLADGTTILATIVNGIPKVVIRAPSAPPPTATSSAALWAPRGFLVYPAYSYAPKGVGLPVVQKGADPYAKENLDPGLDTSRWTPGGPHGQVLLTKDVNAGYAADPKAQAVPIAFGTTGLTTHNGASFDSRPSADAWLAFRPRYSDFVQHYDADPAAPRRAMFEAVNAYRVKNSVDAAYLWPAGFYRPAEVLSYLFSANGNNQAGFPAGYRTSSDRVAKDGDWRLVATNTIATEQAVTGDALKAFTDPTTGTALTQGFFTGLPMFADVGLSNGIWTLGMEERSQWIAAGRRSFQSSDTLLPPISWDGYPAKNLGYATYPYLVNTAHGSAYALGTPIVHDGYYYASIYQSEVVQRMALSSRIYCRGRAIAELPASGLVLGAGVAVLPGIDRLIVIAHQPADNAGLDAPTQGFMRYAHVWFCDFPHSGGPRLHADHLIATQWTDGGVFDAEGVKYDSLWSFAPDGSKAVCLRDHATLSDILDDAAYSGLGEPAALVGAFTRTYPVVGYYAGALKGVVTEIHFSGASYAINTTALAACITTADKPGALNTLPHAAPWLNADSQVAYPAMTPIAADYVDGVVRVAYVARAVLNTPNGYDDVEVSSDYAFHNAITFTYVGLGDTTPVYASDLTTPLLISGSSATPECDFAMVRTPQLVDIATGTFVVSGWSPRWTFDTAAYHTGPSYLERYTPTAASPTCVLNSSAPVHRVRAAQHGAILNDSAYPHPSPMLWGYMDLAERTPTHPLPPPGATPVAVLDFVPCDCVQPFFATRFGETVFGYQVGANAVLRGYYDFGGNCAPDSADYAAVQNAGIFATPTADSFVAVGGWYKASFAVPDTGATWFSEALIC